MMILIKACPLMNLMTDGSGDCLDFDYVDYEERF